MKPSQIEALAKVMARQGLTRVQVGEVVIERPPPIVAAPEGEDSKRQRHVESAIARMRKSKEYKAYVNGAPLTFGD